MSTYYVFVATSFLVGIACAIIAKQRGKDPVIWFLAGAALNVLALGLILFVPGRSHTGGRRER